MVERPAPLIYPNGECEALKRILGKNFLPRSFLEEFRPPPSAYLRPDSVYGLHGEGHSARVNVLGQTLAQLIARRGIEVDPRIIGHFAKTHDLRRASDGHDPQHGDRAAEYIDAVWGLVPRPLVPAVANLNALHVPDDRFAPAMTYTLAVVKDGDGGDRLREEGALDPSYMRLPETCELLLAPASLLFRLSSQIENVHGLPPFDAVMEAGVMMGMIGEH